MSYVPTPIVTPQPPSPRTRELADLLGRAIQEFEKHHPSTTGAEVRQALQIAARSSRSAGAQANTAVLLAVLGLLLFLAGAIYFFVVSGVGP